MRKRHLLLCFLLVPSFSEAGGPAPLNLGNLRLADKPGPTAIGGSATVETFASPYGAFTLGNGQFEGVAIFAGPQPGSTYARKFKLHYMGEFRDSGTGAAGSLYYAAGDKGRFILFGKDRCSADLFEQRVVLMWDAKGNFVHESRALYGRMLVEKKDRD